MSVLYGTKKQNHKTPWKNPVPFSVKNWCPLLTSLLPLDSNSALLTVTWNYLKDICRNITAHSLPNPQVSGRFCEEIQEGKRITETFTEMWRRKQTVLLQNKPCSKTKFQVFTRLLSLQMYHFGLAVHFMDVQPRLALPLLHDFWVEWFPSTYAVLQVHEFVSSQGVKNMKGNT